MRRQGYAWQAKFTKDTLRRQGYAGQAKEEGRCCETGVSLTLVIFVNLVVRNLSV